ncbi:hypothetical protein [Portibacter marinus]|uniref:hypothetical protein n=1 Tax=Portibacter marinus TaxID=2898660 RepID=UPI001F3F1801|nr:hypothetical protein [Portibacter marinus]
MSNFRHIIFIFAIFQMWSCTKDQIDKDALLQGEVYFQIERLNSDSNYVSRVAKHSLIYKEERWNKYDDGTVNLRKEMSYLLTLENGEEVNMSLSFRKLERNDDLLILRSGRGTDTWEYISINDELDRFYLNCDQILMSTNNTYLFKDQSFANLQIDKAATAIVGDRELPYIEFKMNGFSYGAYDQQGMHSPYYMISEGSFKGIID